MDFRLHGNDKMRKPIQRLNPSGLFRQFTAMYKVEN